jgi:hypothetical protein
VWSVFFLFFRFLISASQGWSAAHVILSEEPTSSLLQEMLAKFNGHPFDPAKPRMIDNQHFQEKRGAWNRIPVAVRNSLFEGRSGLDAVVYAKYLSCVMTQLFFSSGIGCKRRARLWC